MHLVSADLRALMPEMGEIETCRVVLGLAEGKRDPAAMVITAHENAVGLGYGGAANERIDAVQITPTRGPTPIVEGLIERGLGADKRRLVGGPPEGLFDLDFAHPHRIPAR